MIIVSQNRKNIINFDNVIRITLVDNNAQKRILDENKLNVLTSFLENASGQDYSKQLEGFGIYVYFDVDNNIMLGKYATEERAKEILQEIVVIHRTAIPTGEYEMPRE